MEIIILRSSIYLLFFLLPFAGHAQKKGIANDTILLNSYCNSQLDFSETNRDSCIYYGRRALAIAQKLNQKFYQASILSDLGYILLSTGDYAIALSSLLKADSLIESPKVADNVISTPFFEEFFKPDQPNANRIILKAYIKNSLALLYGQTGDLERQLKELFEAKKIVETNMSDPKLMYTLTNNIANAYLNMNKLDSALYFQKQVIEVEKTMQNKNYSGASIKAIGDIYYRKGNLDSAKMYYLQALKLLERTGENINFLGLTMFALADVYRGKGKTDSSLYYADAGLKKYRLLGNDVPEMEACYTALALNFKDKGRYDSAYHYISLAKKLKDSLSDKDMKNLSNFQKIGFEEQLRLKAKQDLDIIEDNRRKIYLLISGLAVFCIIVYMLYRNNRQKQRANILLHRQKEEIDLQRGKAEKTLSELKSTQNQLIQKEKLASLGELTAGIAHEIQNPLNFVNNFSELSVDIVKDVNEEINKETIDKDYIKDLMSDLTANQEKINHHGKRASSIVKGMLEHSRTSTGKREPTDINKLADEYLRLSYHGLRAKDKTFNADYKTDFDESLPLLNVVPQDLGRVILNLINNAFYAVNEKNKTGADKNYAPLVTVSTRKIGDKIEIIVKDNGNGIPDKIKEKIFQPFFTTKPTGEGTGLGLSLAYDIITKGHGGELTVESKEGVGSEFKIKLLIKAN